MRLETSRGADKRIWVRPISDEHLFRHCAYGRLEVTKADFDKYVEPMLWVHNITMLDFVTKSSRAKKK
jgi:hypothetical protein